MSSYHPAMAAPGRGRSEFLPLIQENLTRAAWVAAHDGFIPWKEPAYKLNPTAQEVLSFLRRLRNARIEVTADIESNGIDPYTSLIRCVGLGADFGDNKRDEQVMTVPLRHMDNSAWWPYDVGQEIGYALQGVFDHNPLVFQNGGFDTSMLLNRGLMTDRKKTWKDTMMYHHDTPDNDLPHDLGFIARRYFCLTMWKSDIDHKSTDNVNDAVLHRYNAQDVTVTKRLIGPLAQQVRHWGTERQVETDTKLGPILREMGHLGLVVDEKKRGEFSGMLNWRAQRELYQFREIIGDSKFNPRSVPQLQQLLFQKWGYLPVIGADGYEVKRDGTETWRDRMLAEADEDEGNEEVGSTSSGALTALIKHREVSAEHQRAIKTLLEYRAYDKLRGTYVDSLRVRSVDWERLGEKNIGTAEAVWARVWNDKAEDYVDTETIAQRSALTLLNTVYKGHIVPTGRLATQPAVQNWPAIGKANMRDMVVVPPGHVFVLGDFAQLEARLYAVAAKDAHLLQTIRDKKDIHSMNAATLMAKNMDDVDYWYKRIEHGEGIEPSKRKQFRKYWRTVAKRFFFLEVYGGEEDKLFSVMAQQRDKNTGELDFPDLKRGDVDLWHANCHAHHPEIKQWHARCHKECEKTGYAASWLFDCRKRFFLGGVSKKNAVPNMTIQGSAASLANEALIRLVAAIPFRSWSYWTGVNLQVHDALGVMVPEARAKDAQNAMRKAMFHSVDGVDFPADIGTAKRWSKAE